MDVNSEIKVENYTNVIESGNMEGSSLPINEHVMLLPPVTFGNSDIGLTQQVNSGYNSDTVMFGDYIAVDNCSGWMTRPENLLAHGTVLETDTEIAPDLAPDGQNCIYSIMLADVHDSSLDTSRYSVETVTAFLNYGNEDGTPNYLIIPTSAVANSPSDTSSGVSDEPVNSQFSDDTHFSQDDNKDEMLCTGIVLSDPEIPDSIHHEEIVELGKTADLTSQLIPASIESSTMPFEFNEQPTGNLLYGDQHFTNDELNEVLDEVDGPTAQQGECKYTAEMIYSDQFLEQQQQNHPWFYNLYNQDYNFPNHPSLLANGANDANLNVSDQPMKVSSAKRRQKTGKSRKTPKSKTDCKASNSKEMKVSSDKQTQQPMGDPEKSEMNDSQPKRTRKEHTKPRIDINSFRFKMGPHLRTLSAVLEITGMKHVSDFVPYDVIRRFHPTDMFRTIEKAIESLSTCMENGESFPSLNIEPDWEQLESHIEPFLWTTPVKPDSTSSTNPRLYYKCFGNESIHNHVSIRKELEEHGRPTYSPDVVSTVGSANLNVTLNLHHVAEKCINTEFKEPSDNNDTPMLMRLRNPKCTGILYESGVLIVIGTKSYDHFRMATRKFARMIQKTGANVRLTKMKMHFYIGLVKLPFDIDVEAMISHEVLSKYILYDPNTFSGVIIKMRSSPILCLVFTTGAILMTEAASEEEMKNTLDKIYPTVRLFASQS